MKELSRRIVYIDVYFKSVMASELWISSMVTNTVEVSRMVKFTDMVHLQKRMEPKLKANGIKEKWNDGLVFVSLF